MKPKPKVTASVKVMLQSDHSDKYETGNFSIKHFLIICKLASQSRLFRQKLFLYYFYIIITKNLGCEEVWKVHVLSLEAKENDRKKGVFVNEW